MTYGEAQEELQLMWGIDVSKATVCNITMRHGHAAYANAQARLEQLHTTQATPTAQPDKLVMSADGAMVQLTSGQWREVRLVAFGEFDTQVDGAKGAVKARSNSLSYHARLESAEAFAKSALLEWHERGGENAMQVVAVNDGALWIQSFIDYHRPDAIRVIDFAHAQHYLARAGQAVFGAEREAFMQWYALSSWRLGKRPPAATLNHLRLLQRQQKDDAVVEEIDRSIRYLTQRQEMIDYPHFRRLQIPIGSGIGESGHKVVMQRRMKQAGMRWAEANVNPMLTLRTALCNGRWQTMWQQLQQSPRCNSKPPACAASTDEFKVAIVSTKDCERLAQVVRKGAKGKPWQDHRWLFPHRPPLVHRT